MLRSLIHSIIEQRAWRKLIMVILIMKIKRRARSGWRSWLCQEAWRHGVVRKYIFPEWRDQRWGEYFLMSWVAFHTNEIWNVPLKLDTFLNGNKMSQCHKNQRKILYLQLRKDNFCEISYTLRNAIPKQLKSRRAGRLMLNQLKHDSE